MRGACRLAVLAVALASALAAGRAAAVVVDTTAAGFRVQEELVLRAAPDSVYRAIALVGSWWSPDHTWSGDARNLSLDPRPGGCFCERLPGGGVQHLVVVYAAPGRRLRLTGGLGPLQGSGVAGSLTFELSPLPEGTQLRLEYSVGGYFPGGLAALASVVDTVLAQQVARLRRFVETGQPGSP